MLSPRRRSTPLTAQTDSIILNPMVNQTPPSLDRTFAALSDPTRRAIVARLGDENALSVSELARPFSMSLPAVMKHLDVLGDAGLVTRTKVGRTVTCRLEAEPMREAMAWLGRYERFWTASLDRLVALVEGEAAEEAARAVAGAKPGAAASPAGPKTATPEDET
jgi:DNA-binding transcriptional ArsR family regulator